MIGASEIVVALRGIERALVFIGAMVTVLAVVTLLRGR